ncbi:hypothetical protein [Ureibacillus sp. FSL K6-3587]|jgi:DNA replication protein DnaC|uniref:hypothetical protein n=1 Tax=Ureibacillus sp. FSL K6-3587 TaxID=2954681 RepID=UPI0031596DEF
MDKQKEMIDMCKELRLPSIRSLLEQEVLVEQYTSPAEFLYFALKQEMEDRYVRAKANRIRLANFPEKKTVRRIRCRGTAAKCGGPPSSFERAKVYSGQAECVINWLTWYW